MRLDSDEQVANVFVRVHLVKPTRRNYRVKYRKVLRVLSAAREK
jgi:hypothetical protein